MPGVPPDPDALLRRLEALEQAEVALQEREALISQILEAVPGGIVHVGPDGAIQRANAAAQRFLGLSFDEASSTYVVDFNGRTWWEDGSPCPAEEYPVSRCLVTGAPQGPDTIGVEQPSGEVRWGVFTAMPVPHGDRSGAVVTFLDITERKLVEEERERIQGRLQLADRLASLGTLAAGVAHEINNPLTYVIGNLLRLDGVVEGEDLRYLRQAVEGAERVREIVTNLTRFSRWEPTSAEALDVHHALDSAIAMAHVEWRHRARLRRRYGDVTPVRGAEGAAVQVFLNVIVNAAQAIPEGHVDDHLIEVATAQEGAEVVVTVSDSGTGMDPETIQRAFDPFFTTKPVGEGTGLGLSISHGLVESMGGRLDIESRGSGGTTVRVRLPAAEASALVSPAEVHEGGPGPAARILVVDDEPEIREILAWFLDDHHVREAANGREALERVGAEPFDIVLCDLMMPELTGMELYRLISREHPTLLERVVFMTGGAYTPVARSFLEGVSNPVLTKPFDRSTVRGVVRAMLDGLGAP